MKTRNLFYGFAIAAIAFAFTSCSKSSASSTSGTPSSSDAQTQADDQTFYTNETDYATNDVNVALDGDGGSYNQRPASPILPFAWPCDTTSVVVDTTTAHSITITYNGSGCGALYNHKRSGTIIASFSPNFRWGSEGATLTITFNLNVTRVSDGKKMTVSGTRTITNATGGLLRNLITLDSVAYTITDNTTVTFDNGSQRSWKTTLRRTYENDPINSIITVGSLSGTNRFGGAFSAAITAPLIVSECSDFRYTSGQVTYTGALGGTSTITFGLDATYAPISGCVTGALYYQFVWIGPAGAKFTSHGSY